MARDIPQALDAERSLLGGLFLSPEAMDDLHDIVAPGDFYGTAHRKIYEAMVGLFAVGKPFDRVTVKDALIAAGSLHTVGGEEFVDVLEHFVPNAANLAHYAKIISEKAMLRRVLEAATGICALAYEQHGDAATFADEVELRMLAACEKKQRGSAPEYARAVLQETYKDIQADYERGSEITGIASGLRDLDHLTAGFQPGDLIVLAARPSVGKTACGLGWAAHIALHLEKPALVFSLEMGKKQLMKRLLASEARVDHQRIRTGKLLESDWAKMSDAFGKISTAPLIIDESRNLSALDIRSKARREAKKLAGGKNPLALIVVDYLTMMRTDATEESLSAKVGRNALRLKELAGELGVPMVLLAQLNREPAKGSSPRRPVLPDLRDSGEIEQHADVVIFIHREEHEGETAKHELLIEKQRNGPIGSVPVSFRPDVQRFEDLAHYGQRNYPEAA